MSNKIYVCVLQLQYPVYWDLMEFCDGFRKLLDHLQLDKVSVCVRPASQQTPLAPLNRICLFVMLISVCVPSGPSVRGVSGWFLGSEVCRVHTQVTQSALTDPV